MRMRRNALDICRLLPTPKETRDKGMSKRFIIHLPVSRTRITTCPTLIDVTWRHRMANQQGFEVNRQPFWAETSTALSWPPPPVSGSKILFSVPIWWWASASFSWQNYVSSLTAGHCGNYIVTPLILFSKTSWRHPGKMTETVRWESMCI